jgi:hypothetical protein
MVGGGSDEVTVKESPDGHVRLTRLTASPMIPEKAWMTFTAGLRQLIKLRFPSRYSLKAFSRS